MRCPVGDPTITVSDHTGIEGDGSPPCRHVWLDRGEPDTLIEPSVGPSERRPSGSRLGVTDHGHWSSVKPRDRHKGASSTTPPAAPEAAVVTLNPKYTNALLMGRAFAHANRVPASTLTEAAEELCALAAGDRLAIVLAQARFREFVAVGVPSQADERALRLLDAALKCLDAAQGGLTLRGAARYGRSDPLDGPSRVPVRHPATDAG